MMAMLGRPLEANEVVRHRNEDRADNRPENLELTVELIRRGDPAPVAPCPHCGKTVIMGVVPPAPPVDVDAARAMVAAGEWSP